MSGTVNRPSQANMEWVKVKDSTGKVVKKRNLAYRGKRSGSANPRPPTRPAPRPTNYAKPKTPDYDTALAVTETIYGKEYSSVHCGRIADMAYDRMADAYDEGYDISTRVTEFVLDAGKEYFRD